MTTETNVMQSTAVMIDTLMEWAQVVGYQKAQQAMCSSKFYDRNYVAEHIDSTEKPEVAQAIDDYYTLAKQGDFRGMCDALLHCAWFDADGFFTCWKTIYETESAHQTASSTDALHVNTLKNHHAVAECDNRRVAHNPTGQGRHPTWLSRKHLRDLNAATSSKTQAEDVLLLEEFQRAWQGDLLASLQTNHPQVLALAKSVSSEFQYLTSEKVWSVRRIKYRLALGLIALSTLFLRQ